DAYYAYFYEHSPMNDEPFMNNELPTNNESYINNELSMNYESPTNDESPINDESISCEITTKKLINQAYEWSHNQLFEYIGVMAIWIDSNFILRETLLTIKSILSPHMAKNIQSSLNQVISEWELIRRVFCITMDNRTNIKKALDSEYLKLINLTENKWKLLDSLILSLKPFYNTTTIFSDSNYPTFNLIYPTMKLLIKKFEPSDSQTEDDYANILFGPREQISDQSQFIANKEDSFESDIEYEFKTPIPDKIGLIASFLDPQIKNLKFIDDKDIKITTINIVQRLCSEKEYCQPLIEEISKDSFAKSSSISVSNDLMADLYSNEEPDSI
ncbi:13683_t:CDS:2, partial [Gigaspora margarita]